MLMVINEILCFYFHDMTFFLLAGIRSTEWLESRYQRKMGNHEGGYQDQ